MEDLQALENSLDADLATGASDTVVTPSVLPAPVTPPVGEAQTFEIDANSSLPVSGSVKGADNQTFEIDPSTGLEAVPATSPAAPATPPVAAPVTPPEAPPAAPATPPAPAAPVIPDSIDRPRFYGGHLPHGHQVLMAALQANPTVDAATITAAVHARLGLGTAPPATTAPTPIAAPVPAAPPPQAQPEVHQPTAAPAPASSASQTRFEALQTELEGLDPMLDGPRIMALQREAIKLTGTIAGEQAMQQLRAEQAAAQQSTNAEHQIQQNWNELMDQYPQLRDDNSPFAQAFDVVHDQHVKGNSPLLQMPNFEHLIAAQVAQSMGILPTTPGAPAAPQRPAPTAPAAATQPAPTTPPVSAPHVSPATPATLGAVPGSVGSHAPITVTTPNPAAQWQQQATAAAASDDWRSLEASLEADLTGGRSPALPSAIQISIGGQ